MHERTLKYFYEPGKLKLNFFYILFRLDQCKAILKVCYMVPEDPVCLFYGNEKMQLRIRRAGADVGGRWYLILSHGKQKSDQRGPG